MITTFRHVGLWELFQTSASDEVGDDLRFDLLRRLEALNHAERPEDLNLPGFRFRSLGGARPPRYALRVDADWRVTFAFESGHAAEVHG